MTEPRVTDEEVAASCKIVEDHGILTDLERALLDLRDARRERDEARAQLGAWQSAFGTSQLTHAISQLEEVRAQVQRMDRALETALAREARLREALQLIRSEFDRDESGDLVPMGDLMTWKESCACCDAALAAAAPQEPMP
jgi:chromosome segregation ATPase